MQPTINEISNPNAGKMSNEQRQLQQAQLQMQQMAQQMAQMQQQLLESQRPVARTYTHDQMQILLSCETITQILAEFDLSEPKQVRLNLAKEYLLILGDLREFSTHRIPQQEPTYPEQEDELDQNDFMDNSDLSENVSDEGELPPERTTSDDIEEINKKMAILKQEEATRVATEKGKSGIDKIKDFISKKNEPKLDTSNQSESMG